MKDQSLEAFLDNLVRVLLQDVAFYIPKSIFPKKLLRSIPLEFPEHFFDEVFYLDLKNGMMFFEVIAFNEKLMDKPRLFERNIIQLLKKKEELGETEFDYLLEKYFEKVQFYSNLVFFLCIKYEFYFKDTLDPLTRGVFELQLRYYKNHCLELIDRFFKGQEVHVKNHYDLEEVLEKYLPDLSTRLGIYYKELMHESTIKFPNSILQEDEKQSQTEEPIVQKGPKKRLKKTPLLSDQEVEDFILSTVFNVKLNSK
ncbi:MAG: hypothetical protein H7Z76_01285 [Methylotenera sp.]|nr:hypothetical protein [Flavobacterium sp.]